MFELSKTITKDKLYLHGLLKKSDKQKPVILYIHGFEDNFYAKPFISIISESLKDNGYTFLTAETRGSNLQSIFGTAEGKNYICGSQLELLKDARLDIDAWVEFLIEKGYKNIILMGHSLGCQKSIRYMAEGTHIKYIKQIIILSPSDLHGLIDIITQGKYKDLVNTAKKKIAEGKGSEIIDNNFFDLVMSYQTFLSWFTNDHFGKMFNFSDKDNNFMLLNKISIPIKLVVGKNDETFHPSNPANIQEAIDILKLNIKDFDYRIVANADHNFIGKEHDLAQAVIELLEK